MSVRISVTVDKSRTQSNVDKFVLNPLKVVGLASINGLTVVSFKSESGIVSTVPIMEPYEEVFEAIEYNDYVKTVELGITE